RMNDVDVADISLGVEWSLHDERPGMRSLEQARSSRPRGEPQTKIGSPPAGSHIELGRDHVTFACNHKRTLCVPSMVATFGTSSPPSHSKVLCDQVIGQCVDLAACDDPTLVDHPKFAGYSAGERQLL